MKVDWRPGPPPDEGRWWVYYERTETVRHGLTVYERKTRRGVSIKDEFWTPLGRSITHHAPFVLPTRAECVYGFRVNLLTGGLSFTVEDVRRELRGKNLACWCPLPKKGEPDLCHGAVLLEEANR